MPPNKNTAQYQTQKITLKLSYGIYDKITGKTKKNKLREIKQNINSIATIKNIQKNRNNNKQIENRPHLLHTRTPHEKPTTKHTQHKIGRAHV